MKIFLMKLTTFILIFMNPYLTHRACRRDLASWRCGRSSRKLPPRQLTGSSFVHLYQCAECVAHVFTSGPCFHCKPMWGRGLLHRIADMLGYCSGHNPAEDITNHDSTKTTIRLFQSSDASKFFRPSGEQNRETEQRDQTGVILEGGVKVLGCHA